MNARDDRLRRPRRALDTPIRRSLLRKCFRDLYDADAFGLLRIELEITGDEGAVRSEGVALESIDLAIALDGVFALGRRGGGGFAGASHGEGFRNVEAEGGGVTIRGKIGERETARGEEKISAIARDGGCAQGR